MNLPFKALGSYMYVVHVVFIQGIKRLCFKSVKTKLGSIGSFRYAQAVSNGTTRASCNGARTTDSLYMYGSVVCRQSRTM